MIYVFLLEHLIFVNLCAPSNLPTIVGIRDSNDSEEGKQREAAQTSNFYFLEKCSSKQSGKSYVTTGTWLITHAELSRTSGIKSI